MARPATVRKAPAPALPPPPTDPIELLDTPLARSGLAAAAQLRRAGIRLDFYTVRDLLFHLPRRYDDLREMRVIRDLYLEQDGTVVSVQATVGDVRVEPGFRGRIQRTIARLEDDTGSIDATWFGRRYIERRLPVGGEVVVSGKVKHFGRKLTLDNPEFQVLTGGDEVLHAGRIVPVYPLTAGLPAARLRTAIREALDKAGHAYPEYLPAAIVAEERLVAIARAIEEAHYPETFEGRDAALERLAFDELLALQLGMVQRRRQRVRDAAPVVTLDPALDEAVRKALIDAIGARVGQPIDLTVDQDSAMAAIREDLARPTPMLRLLQGDVGSGKTAVAAYALAATARAGLQGALLAPTDLLARQHLETVGALLEGVGIGVTLLTGSLKADVKAKAQEAIASGQALVVVGTHALIQEARHVRRPGPRDHRRTASLRCRSARGARGQGRRPLPARAADDGHADPADAGAGPLRRPRRLESPNAPRRPHRDPDRGEAARRARGHLADRSRAEASTRPLDVRGRSPDRGRRRRGRGAVAAEPEAVRLSALLAPLRVGIVHGRMKAADRDAEMTRFRDGELDVLVGTTVVEVGVDVPAATMMVIQGADRFGLAQLHQLRGRVGRGKVASFCVLVTETDDEMALERLRRPCQYHDGFELAEKDFELRKEGNVLGLAQSGFPRLRVASLQVPAHRDLAARARAQAETMLDAEGSARPARPVLAAELERGWLRHLVAAEPASGT